ncbi:hypothetical protein DSAG12_02647 [Promethearchaeum syntrophicum]|uniref:Smr domain-containing protein n=1 Tax=Promethearchaeum syntrophicum TaxID=2594042 RepID=A0A5B9DD68_9ARCH|nr:hypothetical protein [Candidatus Prometheoarchaeum syntrophicum]
MHNNRFKEAIEKVLIYLRTCWKKKISKISIIHGYHGHILKDYIESSRFIKDMEDEGFFLKKINTKKQNKNNPGVSIFKIEYINHMISQYNKSEEANVDIIMEKLRKLKKKKRINIQDLIY